MTKPSTKGIDWRIIIWVAIIIVTGAGIYFRFADLDADPPLYFAGHGQSLSTDPDHYCYFARSKILFDKWEPYDAGRWRVFEVTLMSGLCYILFLLFDISRYTANLAGVIVSLLSILFFLLALRKFINHGGLLLALFLLMSNKVLLVYGKLPYAENGMILIITLIFFVFVYYRHRLWGTILLGFLIALSAMAGKVFGFLIILPILFCIWYENKPGRYKNIIILIGSTVVTTIVWVLIAYGGRLNSLFDYYAAQTIGQYGLPDALKSPITFLEKLISFGNDTRFYFNAPAAGLAGFFAMIYILYSFSREKLKGNIPILFLLLWFTVGQLFFMPENYRPLRYVYMIFFPLAGLAAFVFSDTASITYEKSSNRKYLFYVILFFLFWILFEQLLFNVFYDNYFKPLHKRLVWFSAPAAIVITLVEMHFKFIRLIFRRNFRIVLIAFIAGFALWNFESDYIKWQKQKSFNIKEAGRELGKALGEDAVICGPLAPTLLLENKLGGLIYGSGITDQDSSFFRKYPITHLIVEIDRSADIVEKFPSLDNARPVTDFWIRDFQYVLVRISEQTGNGKAASYKPTDYEMGRYFLDNKVFDSAQFYLERFWTKHPDSKLALQRLGEVYPFVGEVERAGMMLKRARSLYPHDFSVCLALGVYYQLRYTFTRQQQYLDLAEETYHKVIEMNPNQVDEIYETAKKIAESGP